VNTNNIAIVNRGQNFGMLFGVITKNEEIHSAIFKAIKEKIKAVSVLALGEKKQTIKPKQLLFA